MPTQEKLLMLTHESDTSVVKMRVYEDRGGRIKVTCTQHLDVPTPWFCVVQSHRKSDGKPLFDTFEVTDLDVDELVRHVLRARPAA